MRIVLAVTAALALTGEARAGSEIYPEFAFRNLRAELTRSQAVADGTIEADRPCATKTLNKLPTSWCVPTARWSREGIAGESLLGDPVIGFDEGGFVYYSAQMGAGSFHAVSQALRALYGDPCLTTTNLIQGVRGAKDIPQDRLTWCFRRGHLELYSADPDNLGRSSVVYLDERYDTENRPGPAIGF
ncbi:MAG: hypothetical protein JF570_01780 [Caulobacter sp.]|nr:hypothetical protein [Caulobacter sp.]